MTAPVDVLAMLDRAAESAGEIVKASNGDFRAVIYQDDLFKARAALAELIERNRTALKLLESVAPHHPQTADLRAALAAVEVQS